MSYSLQSAGSGLIVTIDRDKMLPSKAGLGEVSVTKKISLSSTELSSIITTS